MDRKGFLAALAAIVTAPFIPKEEPKPALPRGDRAITPEIMEEFVRKECKRQIELSSTITVSGDKLLVLLNKNRA